MFLCFCRITRKSCEYRLAQADIHNFLAEFYFNSDAEKAREHAEIAAERASSGYVPALAKANEILNKIKGI